MPRKKKPINETKIQTEQRKQLENISNSYSRSEKTAWKRKLKNMEKLIALLNPIEDQLLELQAQKDAIVDDVILLRAVMVNECVHPFDYLVHNDDHIVCKFCNKKIGNVHAKKKNKK